MPILFRPTEQHGPERFGGRAMKRRILRRLILLRCLLLGMLEFRSGTGRTWSDPYTDRSRFYDAGREFAHRATALLH
ncbi:hypothetical protein QCN27_20435 [Cereibacter sp. SYSU M97828]|nr:hypothetical protein [Cereibacter flavus]